MYNANIGLDCCLMFIGIQPSFCGNQGPNISLKVFFSIPEFYGAYCILDNIIYCMFCDLTQTSRFVIKICTTVHLCSCIFILLWRLSNFVKRYQANIFITPNIDIWVNCMFGNFKSLLTKAGLFLLSNKSILLSF